MMTNYEEEVPANDCRLPTKESWSYWTPFYAINDWHIICFIFFLIRGVAI
jgi:hypothetical protein